MRILPALLVLPILCLAAPAADAEMRTVTIVNTGAKPIYKLYGWPSDLVPRTFNLLPQPINPGSSKDINVEDAYNSCVFAFQADFNNPFKPIRPTRLKPKYISMAMQDNINLCGSGRRKISFKAN